MYVKTLLYPYPMHNKFPCLLLRSILVAVNTAVNSVKVRYYTNDLNKINFGV